MQAVQDSTMQLFGDTYFARMFNKQANVTNNSVS